MYRSPEARAEVLEMRDDVVIINFEGSFCDTCGVYDWIEDIVYEAEDFGIKLKIEKVIDFDYCRKVVIFRIVH